MQGFEGEKTQNTNMPPINNSYIQHSEKWHKSVPTRTIYKYVKILYKRLNECGKGNLWLQSPSVLLAYVASSVKFYNPSAVYWEKDPYNFPKPREKK